MKFTLLALILLLVIGCATLPQEKLNHLSLGMTKSEVINVMGSPTSTKAKDNIETLVYFQGGTFWTWGHSVRPNKEYLITLKDGKVTEYGQAKEN